MSRKYCRICSAPHNNSHEGLCDMHLQEEIDECNKESECKAWNHQMFSEMTNEERLTTIFDFMYERGWRY